MYPNILKLVGITELELPQRAIGVGSKELKGKVLVVRIVSDDFTRKLTWDEGAENNSSSCFHELRTTKQCFNR